MKAVVELISEWAAFEEGHPKEGINGFCRYLLQKEKLNKSGKNPEKNSTQKKGTLLRIIGRLSSAYALYHRAAMADMNLPGPESFYYLNSLYQLGEVRKTDLINYQFAETTTGMVAIAKLVEDGFFQERPDPSDARAKLIRITDKGKKKLTACSERAAKVNEMLFAGIDEEAIDLCILLLNGIEKEHSKLAIEVKNKSFDEMYKEVLSRQFT